MADWEKFSKRFFKEWIETLLENLDEDTRKKVLQHCGRFCANQHSIELFKKLKDDTKNLEELVTKLNEDIKGTKWTIIDENSLEVEYERCFCPLHSTGVVNSPTQCNCSTGWLKENLELYLEKDVDITLQHSALQGFPTCKFVAKY